MILEVFVEAIGIFAVAAIGRAARRLHVGHAIRRGTEDAKESFGMHCAGANFGVVRLLEHAAFFSPELHELEDQVLEGKPRFGLASSFTLAFKLSPIVPRIRNFSLGVMLDPVQARFTQFALAARGFSA